MKTRYFDPQLNEVPPSRALIRLHPDGRQQVRVWRGIRIPLLKFFRWGVQVESVEIFAWQTWAAWKNTDQRILR